MSITHPITYGVHQPFVAFAKPIPGCTPCGPLTLIQYARTLVTGWGLPNRAQVQHLIQSSTHGLARCKKQFADRKHKLLAALCSLVVDVTCSPLSARTFTARFSGRFLPEAFERVINRRQTIWHTPRRNSDTQVSTDFEVEPQRIERLSKHCLICVFAVIMLVCRIAILHALKN